MPDARRPHVLMLVDSLFDGTGGAERFAVGLACALPPERYRVSLCATRYVEGSLVQQLDAAGVEHLALGRRASYDLLAFRKLTRFLRRERVDVLHCHKFGSNVWGTLIGRASRVPVVLAHEHTWSYEGQPLRRLLDGKVVGKLATRFVAVSNADRERMTTVEGVSPSKTLTIPTAYVSRGEEPAGDLRAELGIPASAPTIGTIAQLRPQKALGVLIAAFAALPLPDAHLVIVGDGPEREALEREARELGVAERVDFPGVRTDLGVVLGGLDVGVMSSDFEGLPLFAFECMAHHTPLVATRVGGLPDVVEDGITGMLVPPREPGKLSKALEALLGEPERRERIAATAAKRLPEYRMERIAERFADLYDELLADARGRG